MRGATATEDIAGRLTAPRTAPAQRAAPPRAAVRYTRPMTILFVGDVVGSTGRRLLLRLLPELRAAHDVTFVVVNGENVAGGVGITPKIADELLAAGVDAI